MLRSTTVTVTATAVTLACLGASFYASPPVIAESMGRQVQAFSPIDPRTYPGNSDYQSAVVEPSATQERDHSTASDTLNQPEPVASLPASEPRQVDEAKLSPVAADTVAPSRTSDAPTTQPTPVPRIEERLPVPSPSASAEESVGREEALPEDVDSPDSITVIVNKLRPLPADYEPDDLVELTPELGSGTHELREEAAEATLALFDAAQQEGLDLTVVSAYRSYAYQVELYDTYIQQYGTTLTQQMSARPGHSEHQTGLAIDVDAVEGAHTLKQSFGETPAGQWLADHAHEFGFVIRYMKDEHDYTGFQYEPWHLRYFGEQYAQHIVEHSGVAERAFDLDPAPDYKE